ncbi:hypothetical protein KPH14_005884 [Odynerus spinipes]|uniref:Thioredoxin domain-containing protein n=1 Tax=Odynerus spinipes TaxID=1348599 RepID=A0AAD9RCB6_9HYME|nr:hypothetical protein KPH14_005884 [Odynerus spinipes]
MAVTALSTVQEYDEFIKFKDLSIIHFYAPWAEQCKQINDILDEMTSLSEFTKVKFAKIEAENLPEVSLKAGIVAVPTILLYKNGEIIDRIDGVNPALLTEKVKKHLISEDSTPIDVAVPKDALEARLKKLINQAPYNAVREGLKKFSNWPTYPQLYLNGELIGGLDIVKEMSESGELESMLPKKNASQERS